MKRKLAFTLAEILMVMIIIGIIVTVGINTFKQYDKGIRYIYSNTYHVIDRAVFNAMNFTELPNPFRDSEIKNDGTTETISAEDAAERLCNMLTEYINFSSKNCRNHDLADASGDELNDPQFIAANGVRYYITRRLPDNKNAEEDPYFFIVYADINGEKRPNSLYYEPGSESNNFKTVDPDIFAFAIVPVDGARACPLGAPEIDSRYMQTRIQYYDITNENPYEDKDDAAIKYSNVSVPYYISKAEAWGYYLPESKMPDGVVGDTDYIETDPYTYNGYVRSNLPNNNQIYSFLGEGNIPLAPAAVNLRSQSVAEGGYGCKRFSDEECSVIIDKYLY